MYVNLYVTFYHSVKHNLKIAPERRKDKDGQPLIKNVPLFADIRFGGKRVFFFTGYRIDIEKFDVKKGEAKKNCSGLEGKRSVQYNVINSRLRAIKASLELFFQGRDSATKEEVVALLNDVCKKDVSKTDPVSFFGMFELYAKEAKVSEGRRRHINSVINHWKRFENSLTKKLVFQEINASTLSKFESFLSKGGSDHDPKGNNTIRTILSTTRTFWNYAKQTLANLKVEIHYPFGQHGYKLPEEIKGRPIYISSEERDKLQELKLDSEKLKRVRDVFVFQCFVGARVGDLCKLTTKNIENNVLSYIPRKTKEGRPVEARIPLHPKALKILQRYNLPDGRLLPFISDQRYNDYLKELFEVAELTRMVSRLNPRTGEPERVRLCDIASSHMARRAFIGNLYGKVDSGIISSMSGHDQDSRAFSRYYDVDSRLQEDAISKL